jgi:hypothetical protein
MAANNARQVRASFSNTWLLECFTTRPEGYGYQALYTDGHVNQWHSSLAEWGLECTDVAKQCKLLFLLQDASGMPFVFLAYIPSRSNRTLMQTHLPDTLISILT